MDFDLSAEQQELRAVVRAFADEVVAPAAEVHDREATFPLEVVQQMAELGFFGLTLPEAYGGSDAGTLSLRRGARRTRPSRPVGGGHGVGVGQPGGRHDRAPGHRPAEGALAPRPRRGNRPRLVRADRAGRWLRRRRRSHHGETRGRRVGARRFEGVHHQQRHADHLRARGGGGHRPGTGSHAASARSWSQPGPRVSPWVRPTGRWDGTPETRTSSRSTAAASPRITCSVNADEASPRRCRRWTAGGSRSGPSPPASRRPAWITASPTPPSAKRSASGSAPTS